MIIEPRSRQRIVYNKQFLLLCIIAIWHTRFAEYTVSACLFRGGHKLYSKPAIKRIVSEGYLLLYKCHICIKLKGEVGMAVLKSTQTRVVGIITYMVHPDTCFSHYGAMSCIHIILICKASYFSLLIAYLGE